MLFDQPFARRQIKAVENNQRAAGIGSAGRIGRIGRVDPAINPGPVKGKIGAVRLELPAEGGREEGLRRRHIGRGEFNIIYLMMGHLVMGIGFLLGWHGAHCLPLHSCCALRCRKVLR
jgi:hypothetical protein